MKHLREAEGAYSGEGINHDRQPFTGKLTLRPVVRGRGFSLTFSATGSDGTLYHEEHSTIAPGPNHKLTLWNFNSNTPWLLAHELRSEDARNGAAHGFLFAFGDAGDATSFREEIAIDFWDNGDLSYTYSWGMPGGEFRERSGVRMKRIER